MRSSERRGFLRRPWVVVGMLMSALWGCAQHAPEQLALRDRIEQGAITPEDNPRFFTAERQNQAVVASASDPVLRLASELDRQLAGAAGRGDVVSLRQLIKEGAQVNAVDEWGNTALLLAAREGDVETARTLLRAGAEVDGRGGALTPLGQAALRGHTHMVRLLLRSGACMVCGVSTVMLLYASGMSIWSAAAFGCLTAMAGADVAIGLYERWAARRLGLAQTQAGEAQQASVASNPYNREKE